MQERAPSININGEKKWEVVFKAGRQLGVDDTDGI